MIKTIDEFSFIDLIDKARQSARYYINKYELTYTLKAKDFNISRQRSYRSFYETYYNLSGLLFHLKTYGMIYDPINCLSCKFDDAKHVKVLEKSLIKWKPLIMKTTDGAQYIGKINAT